MNIVLRRLLVSKNIFIRYMRVH